MQRLIECPIFLGREFCGVGTATKSITELRTKANTQFYFLVVCEGSSFVSY